MSDLTAAHLALLARQAADLLAPGSPVSVGQSSYAGAGYWVAETPWVGSYVDKSSSPLDALAHILDDISNDSSEGDLTWGQAFPPCLDGHVHPAYVRTDDHDVLFVCPLTDAVAARVSPAAAP